MISKLKIQNLQSHKDTSLDFHPGINVITGPTDVGKSAAFRALEDVVKNSLRGDRHRRHKTKKTVVDLDGVRKVQTASKNFYEVNGKEYKALRRTVPPEVSAALRLSEVNFQGQHETYFLIADSPGQVAKTLNKVADLQIIDDALKAVRHRAREEKSNKTFLKERLKKKQAEVENLQWVLEADKEYQEIEKLYAEIDAVNLSPLRAKIKEAEKLLNLFDSFPYTGKDIQSVDDLIIQLTTDPTLDRTIFKVEENTWGPPNPAQDIQAAADLLEALDKNILTQLNTQLVRTRFCQEEMSSYPQNLDDPTEVIARLTSTSVQASSVKKAISEMLIAEDCFEQAESEVNEASITLEENKAAMGVCPLCENKL